MTAYIIRRLLWLLPLLLVVSVVCFGLLKRAPGDPVVALMIQARGEKKLSMTTQDIDVLRRQHGLDKPIYVQYFEWLKLTVQGDFGMSTRSNEPVIDVIRDRIPNTLRLTTIATILTLLIAIPLGIVSAVRQYSLLDHAVTLFTFLGVSIPQFWVSLMLVYLFAVHLGWLPTGGTRSMEVEPGLWPHLVDTLRHYVLPVSCMTIGGIAWYARYQRAAMLEVIRQDYIRTARAKGLRERAVVIGHAWRNALIPIVTLMGFLFVNLLEGSIVVETIFAWPGMGRLAVISLQQRDYPVVMAITLLSAAAISLGTLLSDVLYAWVDPRIRYR